MNFLEMMQKRYTTKYYNPLKRVSKEDFDTILEAVRLTPSSVNLQPWKFFVADTKEAKDRMSSCIMSFNKPRYDAASHALFICSYNKVDEPYFAHVLEVEEQDGRIPDADVKAAQDKGRHTFTNMHDAHMAHWTGKQSYMALATAMYAAASLGIDTTALEGVHFDKADELLGISGTNLTCQVVLIFGYRSDDDSNTIDIRPKSRLKKDEVILYL